jgi:hypothetical protein
LRHLRELVARLRPNAHTQLTAFGNEFFKAVVVAFASNQYVVEAAFSGAQSLFYRVQAVKHVHG